MPGGFKSVYAPQRVTDCPLTKLKAQVVKFLGGVTKVVRKRVLERRSSDAWHGQYILSA